MNRLFVLALLPALSGCLTAVKQAPVVNWTFAPDLSQITAGTAPRLGEARLAIVTVRSPYDAKNLVVLRADGSVAFDPCNQFAASPAALFKGAALDVLRATGVFKGVQPAVTTADVKNVLELVVDECALDCREEGRRLASVKLTLVCIRDRIVVAVGRGVGRADVADGNYSRTFGEAFSGALRQALEPFVK